MPAYLGKVKETRAVRQWADGTRAINNETGDLSDVGPKVLAAARQFVGAAG
ncbi:MULTISPECIES: hypothetical protein [Rhodococcus]|uniref:hypothetical protein n=1 Tax=Rhodococcus TaxID=1827 RepID=UPI000A52E2BC|nr:MULTISPECIES: hypothetical protein [Rhodococcus]QQZ14306.1 hypothetical protein GO592_32375 [Rhodococcus sp. 21391]